MKLQINVSDEFGAFADKLVETHKTALPEDLKKHTPRSPNALIPLALVNMAKELKQDVPDAIMSEANEVLSRKPGPKKKNDRQLTLVDDRPGVRISLARIATGTTVIEVGLASVELHGCHTIGSAAQAAANAGWGTIPETQNSVPGLRFIPPGAPLVPEHAKPPKPNVTEVGVFVSEAQVQAGPIVILADGRTIPRVIGADGNDKLGRDVIRFQHAVVGDLLEQLGTPEHRAALLSFETEQSFRVANADALEIGWTVRRETRRGKRGFRYIPPGTKLRFVLPEQEVEVE